MTSRTTAPWSREEPPRWRPSAATPEQIAYLEELVERGGLPAAQPGNRRPGSLRRLWKDGTKMIEHPIVALVIGLVTEQPAGLVAAQPGAVVVVPRRAAAVSDR